MELEIKLVAQGGEALDPVAVLEAARGIGRSLTPPHEQLLDASYHDRPDGLLRGARWLLRCRAEGDAWVATVKGPGPVVDGVRGRIEIERDLAGPAEPGDPLPEPLAAALAAAGLALDRWPSRTFRSVVRRTSTAVTLAAGTRAELAVDHGEVRASGRTSPVRELELELLEGRASHLLDAALRLAGRFDVRPGTRTKSGRGLLLLGLLGAPAMPDDRASALDVWEAFAELEERRVEGGDWRPAEHARFAARLGVRTGPDAPGWTSALWSAFARAARA